MPLKILNRLIYSLMSKYATSQSANQKLARLFKKHLKELINNSNAVENSIEKIMLVMRAEILRKIRTGKKTELGMLLEQIEEIIDSAFGKAGQKIVEESKKLYISESVFVTTSVNGTVGASLTAPIINQKLIEQAVSAAAIKNKPMASFWKRQQQGMIRGFRKEFAKGLLEGETMNQLTKRLQQNTNLNLAKNNMRAIARTTLSAVTNDSQLETYKKNSDVVGYIEDIAVLDKRTTFISMAYNGCKWTIPDLKPFGSRQLPYKAHPMHWNERNRLVPGLKSYMKLSEEKKKMIPPEKRASMDGLVPKPESYDDFLKKRNDEELKRMLGKTGAELWKSGKITTKDLIDNQGNPLTQERLKKQFGE